MKTAFRNRFFLICTILLPLHAVAEPDTLRTLTARPLFEPDRRPKDVPAPATTEEALHLTGIVGYPGRWSAIFQTSQADGKSETRHIGQMIQGQTVTAITRTSITLCRDSACRTLKPSVRPDDTAASVPAETSSP